MQKPDIQKLGAANWISAARTCAQPSVAPYTSAMATPRSGFSADAQRRRQDTRN